MVTTYYLARCHDCDDAAGDLAIPFTSHDARRDWIDAHCRGTGHRIFETWTVERFDDADLDDVVRDAERTHAAATERPTNHYGEPR